MIRLLIEDTAVVKMGKRTKGKKTKRLKTKQESRTSTRVLSFSFKQFLNWKFKYFLISYRKLNNSIFISYFYLVLFIHPGWELDLYNLDLPPSLGWFQLSFLDHVFWLFVHCFRLLVSCFLLYFPFKIYFPTP